MPLPRLLPRATFARPGLPAKDPAAAASRRGYVTREVLEVLRGTPTGRAGIQAFRFQDFACCARNSVRMTHRTIEVLADQGDVRRNRLVSFIARMLPNQGLADAEGPLDAAGLLQLGAQRGPLQLESWHGLQPDQGEDAYRDFHAVVKLAGFTHGGRRIALLLDGNDRQSNPAMQVLRDWQLAQGDSRHPGALENWQLQVVDSQLRAQRPAGPSLFQCAFRLVDLDQFLAASLARAPAIVRGDPGVRVRSPLLAPAAVQALRDALERTPSLVERFPARKPLRAGETPRTAAPVPVPPIIGG